MSLHQLLIRDRSTILEKCRATMVAAMGLSPADKLDAGLISLYDQLTQAVGVSHRNDTPATRQIFVAASIVSSTSRKHAQDAHRHGHTISQLVRSYGNLSQVITEHADEISEPITTNEFALFNLCMDEATAQAVTEFQRLTLGSIESSERLKMGVLVHELRNCLAGAVLSHELIRRGMVGNDGSTSAIITNSLNRMRELIDRSVAEARMDRVQDLVLTTFRLFDLVSEVETSLAAESSAKTVTVLTEVDTTIHVKADRHLMVSAITNLVLNAIKYTSPETIVKVRGILENRDALIEVEDCCGGLYENKMSALFDPYSQANGDRSGIGLGLSIVQKACDLNGCAVNVRNLPGKGCIFSIRIPASCLVIATEAA